MDAATVEAGPTAADVERLLLAGEIDAAHAAVAARAEPEEEEADWARLRLMLLLCGRRDVTRDGEALARRLVAAKGHPPADLPALAAALTAAVPLDRAAAIERRLEVLSRRRASALMAEGKAAEASDLLEQTMAALTQSAETFHLYSRVSAALGRPSDTVFALERAVDLAPDNVAMRADLGLAHIAVGETAPAARIIAGLEPDPARQPALYTSLLRALAESGGPDTATLRRAHAGYAAFVRARGLPPRPDRAPGEPPKVGFLWPYGARGADYLMTALLLHRDPAQWSARIYGNGVPRRFLETTLADLATDRLLIDRMSDAEVAKQMVADRIDILVHFTAHGIGGRLGVLDHCPALSHVEWVGGPWPTGHPAVDCLLADPGCAPPSADNGTDTPILRMPVTTAPVGLPLAAADRIGRERTGEAGIAFGWFGPPGHVPEAVVGAWARIVGEVEGSFLHLVHEDWRIGRARQRLNNGFVSREVSHKRIAFEHVAGLDARLERWRKIDIALDAVPVGHLATTLDALAMGVPVVTVAGDRIGGRHAGAALRLLGLDDLVTPDLDAYVAAAIALARSPGRLAAIRRELPDRVHGSPLADGAALTRAFEALLPTMLAAASRSTRP
ncbi:MAG: hypothetical protein IT561_06870 [Alphaproteobacteria bacterium]|nr:hypothetical protein [Alphaproteobacteria bacterium]